ncbi:hypothetical protein ATCR1_07449 [Agrobacterium tumefaciens CCNWGS0286]|nr:hypothetical protein ATCR1_07449 [Agrobacterium tumefaciens CCNWGS0286]
MADATDMPELNEDPSALGMNRVGNLAPALNLLRRVEAGRILVALACLETCVASVIISPALARWA